MLFQIKDTWNHGISGEKIKVCMIGIIYKGIVIKIRIICIINNYFASTLPLACTVCDLVSLLRKLANIITFIIIYFR